MANERTTVGGTILSIGRFPNLDEKYGPYQSKQAAYDALRAIGHDAIVEGLTVGVWEDGAINEYWFKSGTSFNNLVKKGVASYSDLEDKPTINNVVIEGHLTGEQLDLANKIEEVHVGRLNSPGDIPLTIVNKTVRLDFSSDGGNLKIIDGNTGNQLYNITITSSNNIVGFDILDSNRQPYSLIQSNRVLYLGFELDSNNDLAVVDKNNNNYPITTIPIGNSINSSLNDIELNNATLDKINKTINLELSSPNNGNGTLVITDLNANNGQGAIISTIPICDLSNVKVNDISLTKTSKAVNLDFIGGNGSFTVVDKNNNNNVLRTVNIGNIGDENVLENVVVNNTPLEIDDVTIGANTITKAVNLDITTPSPKDGSFSIIDKNDNNSVIKTVSVCDPGETNVLDNVNVEIGSSSFDLENSSKSVGMIFTSDQQGNLTITDANDSNNTGTINICNPGSSNIINGVEVNNTELNIDQSTLLAGVNFSVGSGNTLGDLVIKNTDANETLISSLSLGRIHQIFLNHYDLQTSGTTVMDRYLSVNLSSTGAGELTLKEHQGTASEHTIDTINIINQSTLQQRDNAVYIDYNSLVNLRNNSELVPGTWYIITDYTCVLDSTNKNIISAGWRFAIITLADTEYSLNENAYATLIEKSEGGQSSEEHFKACNLDAWRLKYSLDNDKDRFDWADNTISGEKYYFSSESNPNNSVEIVFTIINTTNTYIEIINNDKDTILVPLGTTYYHSPGNASTLYTNSNLSVSLPKGLKCEYLGNVLNGRGVIYWMQDDFGNEAPYDFKNIQFLRHGIADIVDKFYNGSSVELNKAFYKDFSPIQSKPMNLFLNYDDTNIENEFIEIIPDSNSSNSNLYYYTFSYVNYDKDHYDNLNILDASTIGNVPKYGCYENKIDPCHTVDDKEKYIQVLNNIVFFGYTDDRGKGYLPNNNKIGPQSMNNTFGYGCYNNNIGSYFCNNLISKNFRDNNIGNYFESNVIGVECVGNIFGNTNRDIVFMIALDFSCNVIENNCNNILIKDKNSPLGSFFCGNIFNGVNYIILNSSCEYFQILKGVHGYHNNIPEIPISTYEVVGMNSHNEIKKWIPADLIQ